MLNSFVDDPMIMIIVLQYLSDTKMERVYTRDTLKKN